VSVEDTIKTLAAFVKEGKFDYIGLSEVSAGTLKRANAVGFIIL
jgi:pyridoxine 4-dehydrogenase